MTHRDSTTPLKPCPCCGGAARLVPPHDDSGCYVCCTVCYLASPPGSETVTRWNMRAQPSTPADYTQTPQLPPQPYVHHATVRDGDTDGWHVECRFQSGEKYAAIHVCESKVHLADWIAAALVHAYSAQARPCPVCRRPLREHPAPHLGGSCDHCEMAFTETDLTLSWKPDGHTARQNLAHTLWAVAQLGPGEGIEDAVQRILAHLPTD